MLRDFEIKGSAPQQMPPSCDPAPSWPSNEVLKSSRQVTLLDGNDAEREHLQLEKVLAYFSSQF
jgi:hypothetical protein